MKTGERKTKLFGKAFHSILLKRFRMRQKNKESIVPYNRGGIRKKESKGEFRERVSDNVELMRRKV